MHVCQLLAQSTNQSFERSAIDQLFQLLRIRLRSVQSLQWQAGQASIVYLNYKLHGSEAISISVRFFYEVISKLIPLFHYVCPWPWEINFLTLLHIHQTNQRKCRVNLMFTKCCKFCYSIDCDRCSWDWLLMTSFVVFARVQNF